MRFVDCKCGALKGRARWWRQGRWAVAWLHCWANWSVDQMVLSTTQRTWIRKNRYFEMGSVWYSDCQRLSSLCHGCSSYSEESGGYQDLQHCGIRNSVWFVGLFEHCFYFYSRIQCDERKHVPLESVCVCLNHNTYLVWSGNSDILCTCLDEGLQLKAC